MTSIGAGTITSNAPLATNKLRLTHRHKSIIAPVNVTQLNVLLSGAGSMQLSGDATNLAAERSGVGSLYAYDLLTNVSQVTV